jgi:F0F1-type ATP synthase assembly protein I
MTDASEKLGPKDDLPVDPYQAAIDAAPKVPESLRTPSAMETKVRSSENRESVMANVSTAWGVAMDFVGCVIGALLLGYFADQWQGTGNRYTLIGMAVGFAFALYRIISRTLAEERREQQRRGKK